MKTSEEKRLKIKQSLANTREKRKSQVCKIFQLKIDENHLNKQQKQQLKILFIEAKWFYNFILSNEDIFNKKDIYKIKKVQIKVLDNFENRDIKYLSSQMRESLYNRICEAIKVLSKLKKINFKIGKLKFKPEINCIDLPQYNITWKIQNNRIKIQGLKKTLKISGLEQIPKAAEFANACLIRKPSGYYIHITCFLPRETKEKTNKEVGLDFGIKNNITTSDNITFNASFKETEKLKKLQKALPKKKLGSNNRKKLIRKIRKEYELISNKKHDAVNKIVSYLTKNYDKIYIQDEMIKSWHKSIFSKQVQHSILGAIKSRLKTLESVQVISKKYPTTKLCYNCGTLNKIALKDRVFKCSCGFEMERDLKAAKTILLIGQFTNSGTEYTSTLIEKKTSEFLKQFKV